MPSPFSTQQAVEELERFGLALDVDTGDPEMDPTPTGRYVRLSDVLNALQDVGGGDGRVEERAELAGKLRAMAEDMALVGRGSRLTSERNRCERDTANLIRAADLLSQPQAGEEEGQ